MKSKLPVIDVWTDGACFPNPGVGGWSAILVYDGSVKELSGKVYNTTSNMMELHAIYEGLAALKIPCSVTVYTDSRLCIGWLEMGWKRKKPHIRTICESIDAVILEHGHEVTFKKVPAHCGVSFNERADYLAYTETGFVEVLDGD